MSDLDDRIRNDPDSNELLCDSIAKSYINASVYKEQMASKEICEAIVNKDHELAGQLLSDMVYANVEAQAEKAKKEKRSAH